jgi:choline-sulfatase
MNNPTRRGFLQVSAAAGAVGESRRPNVLFIMADQFRADCLGVNGNKIIRTPNLDRLAAQSANFTHTFVQAPVCVPSRISFFTGRYPHSHKNRVNYTPCDSREVMIAKILQQAGYQTGSDGKLHFYPPTPEHARSTGFERVVLDDGVSSTDPFSDYVKWRNPRDPKARIHYHALAQDRAPGGNPFRGEIEYKFTPTAWVGAKSTEMLREFASSPRPFFLFASFFKPHAPHTVPVSFDSMYDGAEIPLPRAVTLEEIRTLPQPVQRQILRGRPEFDMDRTRLQWIYRSYYAGISMVDREVGRILEELERSGKAQDTIVIFTSDHGDQLLEHGLQGKNLFFEASVRVPLLLCVPNHVPPAKHPELVETIDLMPTILNFCGIPVPENCQGRPFAPREVVFAENIIPEVITGHTLDMPFVPGQGVGGIRHPDAKMVRTRRWKLNYYPANGGELYDLENDPGEFRNLYVDPAHQGLVRELQGQILDWLITADENDQIARHWLV